MGELIGVAGDLAWKIGKTIDLASDAGLRRVELMNTAEEETIGAVAGGVEGLGERGNVQSDKAD